jgi:WD40 repeat protein
MVSQHLDMVNSVIVTPDNRFIISGSDDESIKVFDLYIKQEESGNFRDFFAYPILSRFHLPNYLLF